MIVKELRSQSGLTQREFAAKYHISMRTLQGWESCRRTPPQYVPTLIEYIMDLERRINDYEENNKN